MIKTAAAANDNNRINTESKWHRIISSPLHVESDRCPIQVLPQHHQSAKKCKMTQDMFHGKHEDCTLLNELDELQPNENLSVTVSPSAYFGTGMATESLIHAEGDPKRIVNHWQSLLCVPLSVIYHKTNPMYKAPHAVVKATETGLYALPCTSRRVGTQHIFLFETREETQCWNTLHIEDHSSWLVQDVLPLPPSQCRLRRDDGQPYGCVLSATTDRLEPLIRYSASRAFPGLTKPFLLRLIGELEIGPDPQPKLLVEILRCLLGHIFPEMDEDSIDAIIAERAKVNVPFESVLRADNVEGAAEILGDEATKEGIDELQKFLKSIATRELKQEAKASRC